VRFTRCLYAQLNSQNFHPPKSYRMPSDIRNLPLTDRRRLGAELGLKLVCGLEILYQNQLRAQATRVKKRAAEMALQQQRRAREARGGIVTPKDTAPIHPGDVEDESINHAATIDTILGTSSTDEKKGAWPPSSTDITSGIDEFKQTYEQLGSDDSDDWMTITPQQIDDIFAQRNAPPRVHIDGKAVGSSNSGSNSNNDDSKRGKKKGNVDNGEEMDLNTLVDSMSAFVEKVSGHRGVTVPKPSSAPTTTAAKKSTSAAASNNDNDEPEIEVNLENVMKMLANGAPSSTLSTSTSTNKPSSSVGRPRQTRDSDDDDDNEDDGTDTDGERDPFRRRAEYVRGGMGDDDYDGDDGDLDQLDDHEADDDDIGIDDDMYRDDDIDEESHAGLSSLSISNTSHSHGHSHGNNSNGNVGGNGLRHPGREPQLMDYMQQMDRELRAAGIGNEFARSSSSSSTAAPSKRSAATTVPNIANDSDDDVPNGNGNGSDDDIDNEDDDTPVDPKFNLVTNMLESYNAQSGNAGPVGNLLASLGVRLPDNSDASSALSQQQQRRR
jgi:hypothetical protein